MSLLGLVDPVEDRPDLVDRVVGIAADLELDERRVLVGRDLTELAGSSGERTCWTTPSFEIPATTSSIAAMKP